VYCQIQPTIATEALLAVARKNGARVFTKTDVTALLRDPVGAVQGVHTNRGEIKAKNVVVAAGPWSGQVSEARGAPVPIKPRRGNMLVTSRMPHRVFQTVYDGDDFGAAQSAEAARQSAAVINSSPVCSVLIGSRREQVGFNEAMHANVLAEMAQNALRVLPFLSDAAIIRSCGGFRPYMPDHLPIIGDDPRIPGLFHASGHEGAGIGLSV